ncbi:ABC transporter ATP-binding protein [Streptomyces brasiliensis]|uniref:ABC transporter ATP-binding protein n=1 Tax=Streptomyces brasiliensis TaxID=1954 RepID=A0A917L250_9ACTN|nr:ATP-binding cassette domain-containing protein [Streptomyces brasiliensis]GGJ41148.1 ABC transporter ATP-binding protein [Streptomyces brasiliensis]
MTAVAHTEPATARGAALRATSLVAGYGDLAVVRGLDIEVRAGEIVALLGPNGAGKSTTLLTLAGELRPLGGEISWFGSPLTGGLHKRAASGLGFVPEERSVIMSMSVRDNLLLGSGGIEPAVEVFPELGALLDRRAGLLSGGEQQMLTLGRALARRPKVLLADELSLGLGPIVVDRLLAALRDAATTLDIGVLLVEQQARRALAASDRWYLMRRGELVASGDSSDGMDEIQRLYLAGHDSAD